LLAGLVLSGLLLVTGLAFALLGGQVRPDGPPPSAATMLREACKGSGVAFLDLGLLVLLGTPVCRVAVLAVGWGLSGERRFSAVALVVLSLLGIGLLIGVG
jgi:hypothetical protein